MEEFYQNQDIVVRFTVLKDGKPVSASSAKVPVYGPDRQFIGYGETSISGSEVRGLLKAEHVEKVGKYIFMFKVKIRNFGEQPHVVEVKVKKSPVPEKRRNKYGL